MQRRAAEAEVRAGKVVSIFSRTARRDPGAAPARRRMPGGAVRTIAVTSGKGGVGKTCLTANLAVALARRGARVLLVDADLGLANVDTLFGLQPRATLRQVVAGECDLADVLLEGPDGVRIVPASSGFDDMARLDNAQIALLLARFEEIASTHDAVLLDTGAGISPTVLSFVLAADDKLVVVTPEPTSLTDAYAVIKVLATRYGERRLDVLVNQARSEREAARTFTQLAAVTERFLGLTPRMRGFVPFDPEVREAVRRQRALVDFAPGAPASCALDGLATELLAAWSLERRSADGEGDGPERERRR
ncbi:MAG: MinD/ParA family protein [Thermodesulfobacteriota bacterium]